MRAIILAAGSGTRLSPLTDSCPKCLVRVGERPMIDYQLAALDWMADGLERHGPSPSK